MNSIVRPRAVRAGALRATGLLCFLACAMVLRPLPASAQEIQEVLINGNFEAGYASWQIALTNTNGCGTATTAAFACWFPSFPGDGSPLTGFPTSADGNAAGLYMIADATQAGIRVLYQDFTIPATSNHVIWSYDMYVNDWALLTTYNASQSIRVDLQVATPTNVADLGTSVLLNTYLGTDGGPVPNEFLHYEFDITPYVAAGGNFRVRYYQTNNLVNTAGQVFVLNAGVDNVSVRILPEPSGVGMAMLALAGFGWKVRKVARRRLDTTEAG